MAYRVRFTSAAIGDIEAMLRYYREVSPVSLGRLESELRAFLAQVSAMPHAYQTFEGDIRRAHLATFPYTLYYRVRKSEIEIAAVLPQRFGLSSLTARLQV